MKRNLNQRQGLPNTMPIKRAAGFTLIEVMVVIVILGVLAALIVPNVMGRAEKAKVDTTVIKLQTVAGYLDQYKLDNGDRKSTRLNSSHVKISYAVFCLKKKTPHCR